MIKVYKAYNNLSVPVVVDGKIIRYIEFGDENNTYRTGNVVHQNALENLPCYNRQFKLLETIKDEAVKKEESPVVDAKEFPDITEWQEAKDILRKDFDVPHQSLNTPDNILKKAKEVGVYFPKLSLEQK